MKSNIEPANYVKEILSYLQNDWQYLRDSVVEMPSSELRQRLLFYINKAMRWKSVHDLSKMKETLLLIFDIVCQEKEESVSLEIIEWLEDIREVLGGIIKSIRRGGRF